MSLVPQEHNTGIGPRAEEFYPLLQRIRVARVCNTLWFELRTFSPSCGSCSRLFCRSYDEVMNRRKRCCVEQRGDRARRRDGR